MASSADPLGDSRRTAEVNLFASQPADGAHELIVSCADHRTSLSELSPDELILVIDAWRLRMREYVADSSYVHLSVTERPGVHSHAELHALRFVPAEVARERERAAAYHQRTMGGHMLGDVTSQEVRRRERLVAIDDEVVLIAPWASRSPFELRIVPRRPDPSFESADQGTAMLARTLAALAEVFGSLPPLSLWVRTAPRGTEEFCWHLDLVPALQSRAGFEAGTGVGINGYEPERAAADLRSAFEAA